MISYVIITLVNNRGVAQLGARLTGGQEAAGSSPVTPTIVSIHNTGEYSLFFFTFPHS